MNYICARNIKRKKKARKIYIRRCITIKKRKKEYICKIDINEIKNKIKSFSETLNFLFDKNFLNESDIREEVTIKMPKIFSVIETPNETFKIIKDIVGYTKMGVKKFYFDYSETTTLEIGAISLKNVICLNLEKRGISLSGNFPGCKDLTPDENIKDKYQEALAIFVFSGLFSTLRLKPEDYLDFTGAPLILPLIGGGKNKVNIPCSDVLLGKVEQDVTSHFNRCLRNINKELNENGLRIFDQIIGEVIANCQEHSGEFNQYFCSGYYANLGENLGNYQLSIFNFGQTIYEGLKNSEKLPREVKERMEELIEKHKKKLFFMKDWDEEALVTLFSLQNKVSRVYEKGKQRGTGTVRMLNSFQEVGGCHYEEKIPKMTIISGNIQIIVDNSEICQLKNKQLTFNMNKTLDEKPDKNYVKKIKNYFPGTMISLSIYLDKEWLDDKLKK